MLELRLDRQLEQLTSGAQVDDELAKMKTELGVGAAPAAGELGSGSSEGTGSGQPQQGAGQ